MKKWLCLALMMPAAAQAEYVFHLNERAEIGTGFYVRALSGKIEHFPYNNVMKSEAFIRPMLTINDEWRVSGHLSGRYVLDDRFVSKNKFKIYDAYGSVQSETWGRIDIGDVTSVAYKMHQAPKDVGLLDLDDSDIGLFLRAPQNFYAPMLTYIDTDSRDPKINYTLPAWQGVKWGISLVQSEDAKPDTCAGGDITADHGKGVLTSVLYKGAIASFQVAVSAGFAHYRNDRYFFKTQTLDAHHSEYATGINVEKNHISVGAAYRKMTYQRKTNITDSDTWSTGVAYDNGTVGVSVGYLHSKATYLDKNTFEHLMLSGKYQINKYLKTALSVGEVIFKANQRRQDGLFAIAGVQLSV